MPIHVHNRGAAVITTDKYPLGDNNKMQMRAWFLGNKVRFYALMQQAQL